jgi:hypothetical protein
MTHYLFTSFIDDDIPVLDTIIQVRRHQKKYMRKHMRLTETVDLVVDGMDGMTERMDGMTERMDNGIRLVDTWLEKNMSAEGEVTLLRERVNAQEIQMGELRARLARAESLIEKCK